MNNTFKDTILKSKSNKSTPINTWYLKLAPNTILTMEIISIFTQEFYDQVISITNTTYNLYVEVTMADGRNYNITPGQWVNKTVPLSELVEIIYCFWANELLT